ncbi:ABC transporter ATP-binding protein [Alicyclobacillus curvatus]|nr:ABC transporter ATP-binding protein [Alicyclobacillus curvatus]
MNQVMLDKQGTDTTSKTRADTLLAELRHMNKKFSAADGDVWACKDINLQIRQGRSLGLVGESGSGKSTLIRVLQMLIAPTSGDVYLDGVNVTRLSARRLRPHRRIVQFVAQDPYGSLFPNLTVGQNIAEPLDIYRIDERRQNKETAAKLMATVGLPIELYHAFPHEISGGQQQRVAIARALALYPRMLVLDEAVSSLDVSIQAQILNLLQTLKEERQLTYVFVSHNLAVIRLMCEQTAVMYRGQIVEQGETLGLFASPSHPYTRALIGAIPAFTEDGVTPLGGVSKFAKELTKAEEGLTAACPYAARCPFADTKCRQEEPHLREVGPGHEVACHYAESVALTQEA